MKLWKEKYGEFKTIDQLLELDGFGVKVLENFCNSIINKEDTKRKEEKLRSKSVAHFTTPKLNAPTIANMRSCVSLHVGINTITWTKFDIRENSPTQVSDWNIYDLGADKLSLFESIKHVIKVNGLIPQADIYVLENQQSSSSLKPGSAAIVNINVQKSQLISMICLILANRPIQNIESLPSIKVEIIEKKQNDLQNLIFLRQYLSSRLFRTYIGSERVSTASTIIQIFEAEDKSSSTQANPKLKVESGLSIPFNLRNRYNTFNDIQREILGQSLLIGLTFLRLCVIKCRESLENLNKRN